MPDGAYAGILILLLVFLVALLFRRRLGWMRRDDLKAQYHRACGMCILYAILIPVMVLVVFWRHDQSLIQKLSLPGCFVIVFGAFFYQFLEARRKLRARPGFVGKKLHRSTIRLLLQAVLILLPVIGLAGLGLYSLRQDRLLAEQEAREAGLILAQSLAQTISTEAVQQLRDYREMSFELEANRSADLGLSGWQGGAKDESNAWVRIKAWQQANPEIDLFKLPPVDLSSYWEAQPERMPPQPPDWLGQFTPAQQQLWQAARQAEFQGGDLLTVQSAIQKFIDSKPPQGAQANAEYLLLLAKTHGLSTGDAVSQIAAFSWSHWGDSDEPTDAGLPLGQLICYQALHQLPDGAGWPENFIRNNTIAWMIQYRSSIFSPILIAEARRVARGPAQEHYAATLKDWWNANAAARTVLQDFGEQHPTNTWHSAPFWVDSRIGEYLFFLGDRWEAPSLEPRYACLMLPQVVVEKALAVSVKQSEVPVPAYATVEFDFGGKAIGLSHEPTAKNSNSPWPLLGQADGMIKDLPLNEHSYPFRIQVFLADPGMLYARQAQRSRWFGALIVASVAAAVMGLFSAWRSFRRELRLNEMKTNFVSSVSHELRAPIASVRLMAENLEGGKIPEPERQKEYYRFIGQECRRLSSLIENVLDFSRIEQGRKQYEFEPTDLVALAQTTVRLMEPYAAEKGVKLEVSGLQTPPSNVEWNVDARAIQQALVNLMDNAIKHSAQGQIVTMEIGPESQSTFSLSVSDHGPGIPITEQDKIFERFYRLGSELRRETRGIGVGLSIVKHIVEAHGGRVSVQSAPGRGSRFTIELTDGNAKAPGAGDR